MKKYLLLPALIAIMVSCKDDKEQIKEQVAAIPVGKIDIQRFDKIFYESKPGELAGIKQEFPYLFPSGNEDEVWLAKINNPLLQELHKEVEKQFPDTRALQESLYSLFQHTKYYFPDFRTPKVVTLISEMDYENRIIYADSLLLVSLDLYLGKGHKFYVDFPSYQRELFEPSQIVPDIATKLVEEKIALPNDRSLMSLMIYFGKELYLKDLLLPDAPDADKIGYTPGQIKWVQDNEADMWRYFVDEKLLFSSDPKLPSRFINPAPFSKFYLEVDNDSPGRTGIWLGWQIVRSYMENNKDIQLEQMLKVDAKEIFDNSKYKPKK